MLFRRDRRRKWRGSHIILHTQKVTQYIVAPAHCCFFDGSLIGHAIVPLFPALSCSPPPWSSCVQIHGEASLAGYLFCQGWRKWELTLSPVCFSGVQFMLVLVLTPTLCPSSLPYRLQTPASDVKTADHSISPTIAYSQIPVTNPY